MLDAAQRLFARKGYTLTSLKEIGEEAEVSRGTPSYFFGSKEGLYVAVKERLAEGVRVFAGEARGPATDRGEKDPPGGTGRRDALIRRLPRR